MALGLLAILGTAACHSSDGCGAGFGGNMGGAGGSGGAGGGGAGGSGGTGGGAPACGTCAQVFAEGGIVCGNTDSADAWQALSMCACSGACNSACSVSFCMTAPADMMCGMCLEANCSSAQTDCAMN